MRGFATSSNVTLTSVTLLLARPTTGTASVQIYSDQSGKPGALVGTLVSPGSFSTNLAQTTFTTAGLALNANTTYWVVLKAGSGAFNWSWTADNTGAGAGFRSRWATSPDGGGSWTTSSTFPLQMEVTAE